jgi:small subunit ribosomal protein S4e
MARGPKKHLKRYYAPSHWMLDKLSGDWAPRPSTGPHKLRECLPLIIMLRNRLKYALTYNEAKMIVMQKLIKVDGKVRTDMAYPAGFMDVIQIEKTNEIFRLLLDVKGRFRLTKIKKEESAFKLCKIKKVFVGDKGTPYAVTHDARTLKFPDPEVKVNDTVKIDIASGSVTDFVKFENGNLAMITGGHSVGRVGVITHREKHPGQYEIIHLKDKLGRPFATRLSNVFVIGKGEKSWVTLAKGDGIKLTNLEDRQKRLAGNKASHKKVKKQHHGEKH